MQRGINSIAGPRVSQSLVLFVLLGLAAIIIWSTILEISAGSVIEIIVLFITLVVVYVYTKETHRMRQQEDDHFAEQQKQLGQMRRPFLRLAWECRPAEENGVPTGITRSCLVLVNEGQEKMMNVRYQAWAGVEEVGLSHHPFIQPNSPTTVVYDRGQNEEEVEFLLGNQDDQKHWAYNDAIFQQEPIRLRGTYFDPTGKEYEFEFEKDFSSQSGFIEITGQGEVDSDSDTVAVHEYPNTTQIYKV